MLVKKHLILISPSQSHGRTLHGQRCRRALPHRCSRAVGQLNMDKRFCPQRFCVEYRAGNMPRRTRQLHMLGANTQGSGDRVRYRCELGLQEVGRRRADESRDEFSGGIRIDVEGRANLIRAPPFITIIRSASVIAST